MTTSKDPFNPKLHPESKVNLPLSTHPTSELSQLLLSTISRRFITAYGPKERVSLSFPPDEGRTKQSFKDECDINQIMSRYQKTGILEFVAKHAAQYGDCTGIDYQEGMQILTQAKSMFAELPSSIRTQFHNDPGEFLDFVNDPENRAEMREMGLLKPEPEVATPPAPSTEGSGSGAQKPPVGASVASEGENPPVPKKK